MSVSLKIIPRRDGAQGRGEGGLSSLAHDTANISFRGGGVTRTIWQRPLHWSRCRSLRIVSYALRTAFFFFSSLTGSQAFRPLPDVRLPVSDVSLKGAGRGKKVYVDFIYLISGRELYIAKDSASSQGQASSSLSHTVSVELDVGVLVDVGGELRGPEDGH